MFHKVYVNNPWVIYFLLGLLISLGHAPTSAWPASIVGLAVFFALRAKVDKPLKLCFKDGWWLGFGYFLGTLNWIIEPFLIDIVAHGWMAPFAVVFMSAGLALFWGMGLAFGSILGGKLGFVIGLGIFEFARGFLFTGFPWGLLAYIWVDTPIAQLAGYIGAYGLTVLTFGISAVLAHIFFSAQKVIYFGVFALSASSLWIWNSVTLESSVPSANAKIVRVVQPNAPQDKKFDPRFAMDYFEQMVEFSRQKPKPDLIVWPETALPIAYNYAEDLIDQIEKAVQDVPVLLGALRIQGKKLYNSLIFIDPDDGATVVYDKHHLVPFGEYLPFEDFLFDLGLGFTSELFGTGFEAGDGTTILDIPNFGRVVPLICYEAVFPRHASSSNERPDIILQVTNDAWFGSYSGPHQHLAQAQMRSIEQGLPFVRVANTGISGLINPSGHLVKKMGLGQAGYIDVEVPNAKSPTLYSRFGNWTVLFLLIGMGICHLIFRFRH